MWLLYYFGIVFQCDPTLLEAIHHPTRDWGAFGIWSLLPNEFDTNGYVVGFRKNICQTGEWDLSDAYWSNYYTIQPRKDNMLNRQLLVHWMPLNDYVQFRERIDDCNLWVLTVAKDLSAEFYLNKNGQTILRTQCNKLVDVKQQILDLSRKLLM